MTLKKIFLTSILTTFLFTCNISLAYEDVRKQSLYPDYGFEYNGNDKYETFNRKMFNFNLKLNKYAIKPIHIIWASIIPQYGMDRIQCACSNIEFPIRITSCLIQKDFKSSGREALRFLTNSTIGLGGLYDPANKLFNINPVNENMEQALAMGCKIKSGSYIVLPILSSTTPRGIFGKILDVGLNPSSYIGTPVIAMVKAGLLVNKTSNIQAMAKTVQSNFADPYDVTKKIYGLDSYIKNYNLDRDKILEEKRQESEQNEDYELVNLPEDDSSITIESQPAIATSDNKEDTLSIRDIANAGNNIENVILKSYDNKNSKLMADLILDDFNPQTPTIDAMRTALFNLPGINNSIWNELSIWNRTFNKKIKTSDVNIYPNKENYKFRYILQKDKSSPLAIIYPSIGEGIMSYHSMLLAKLFYDEGYSVIIQGSHFHWEFAKSMPDNFTPGIPCNDIKNLKLVTSKIINKLETKYERKFENKTVIGTSFGAVASLYLGAEEAKENTLNINKYIAISPPVELVYAIKQIDKNNFEWNKNPNDLKNKVALTAAKVLQLYNDKEHQQDIKTLPFSNEEAKLITGFVMHQKLSDLVFTLAKTPCNKKCEIYTDLNNLTYQNYVETYILPNSNYSSINELTNATSLFSISDFLGNSDKYKIYESLDDYFVNQQHLKKLKQICKDKTVILSNGSHLGFLYREEFLNELKKDISLNNKISNK